MELIAVLKDILLHLDTHVDLIIRTYGLWTYAIFSVIIFCETGFVVTPFLPGDSLLFASGTFAAMGSLNLFWLIVVLSISAIAGDTVNYWAGHIAGPKVFHKESSRFFNRKHLDQTHRFYEKYGGKTIVLARFIPIIRTFSPFVAGIGSMSYPRFLAFNVFGGILWVVSIALLGYFFGNIPIVRNHYSLVILAIIVISVLPGVVEFLRQRR
jgi:membrane-associated protein